MTKRFVTGLILLIFVHQIKAQVNHVARYESLHESRNGAYLVIPNEDKGLLLIKPIISSSTSDSKIEVAHLGLNLKEKWQGVLDMPSRFDLGGYYYDSNITYLLFQVRSDNRFIRIVTIDTSKKEIKSFEPRQIIDLTIFEFDVINGSVVIGGYLGQRPAVYVYNMENGQVHTLSNVYQNDSELFEVRTNSDGVTFNVLVSQFDEKQDKTVQVSTYDYNGNMVRTYQLNTDPTYQLVSGMSSSIYDKSQVVVGLYSVNMNSNPSGFFINQVNKTGEQTMRYVNFGEFDTFLNHLGKKRSLRMKTKALAAKEMNKEWQYKIDVLPREMEEVNGRLVLFGEYFKPWNVRTLGRKSKSAYAKLSRFNNPFLNPNSFNGAYRLHRMSTGIGFKNGFALVLDQEGKILWDGAMDINESIYGGLVDLGSFQWHDGKAYYAYHHDDELRMKHLNKTESTQVNVSKLTLLSEEDMLSKGAESPLKTVGWYDNQFLVYGMQYVRPIDKSENTRKVFFINAISIGPDMQEKED